MTELDHIFVMCPVGAEMAAQALRRVGLKEGSRNDHEGQGTACRRFFFDNAYVELMWVSNSEEAQSELTRRTRLWERWYRLPHGASPFGIVLRAGRTPDSATCPFPSWAYRPRYLPSNLCIEIAAGTPLEEPEFIYLGFQRDRARQGAEPTTHAIPVQTITSVTVALPALHRRSATARVLETKGLLKFEVADEYCVSLTLDGNESGDTADLRPDAPLILHW